MLILDAELKSAEITDIAEFHVEDRHQARISTSLMTQTETSIVLYEKSPLLFRTPRPKSHGHTRESVTRLDTSYT
jgi:hypothetical protein